MDREQVLACLREHEAELKDAGLASLSLFGSTARGDARPNSGVDLRAHIDRTRRLSLLDVVGIEIRLSDLPVAGVDLIVPGTLKPWIQRSVEAVMVRAL